MNKLDTNKRTTATYVWNIRHANSTEDAIEYVDQDRLAHKTSLLEAVEKEIAIHEYLSESWTGIKLTGEKLKTNPHDEQVIAFRKAKDLINKIYE